MEISSRLPRPVLAAITQIGPRMHTIGTGQRRRSLPRSGRRVPVEVMLGRTLAAMRMCGLVWLHLQEAVLGNRGVTV